MSALCLKPNRKTKAPGGGGRGGVLWISSDRDDRMGNENDVDDDGDERPSLLVVKTTCTL